MNPKINFLLLFSISSFLFPICIAIGDHRSASFTSQDEESQAFQRFFVIWAKASKVPSLSCLTKWQGYALQIILEHGEKLSAMIQLRELQILISQNRSTCVGSSNSNVDIQMSGALWDMIQLVGERARRNTVLLMDRDSAEVFYIRTCFDYKNENRFWYPPPEGLTPWYCQPVVRKGIWSVGSVLVQLLNDTSRLDRTAKLELYNHLEALAEVLLEAYSGAVTAKIERGEEHKGVLNEYWERRDALLESLYQQVKEFEATYKDSIEGAEELNEEATSHLEALAEVLLEAYFGSVTATYKDSIEGAEELNEEATSHLLSIAKWHGCYKVIIVMGPTPMWRPKHWLNLELMDGASKR
ncbi:hypothetical protein P8452_49764 [Trifolium repens]|nr:hypothetical protein P8452_49764 [Trifolium repens]